MDSQAMSTSNKYIKYHISVYENSTNINNNTSNVTVHVYFWRTNTGYSTYGTGTVYCRINGTTYSAGVSSSQKITNSGIVLFNTTVNVGHNGDGSKVLTCSAWINHSQFSSSEQSANFTLSTIPRASSIDSFTCSSSYLDGTFTVKYTPKASFNQRLRLSIPNVAAIRTIDLGTQGTGQKSTTASFTASELTSIYTRYTNTANVIIGAVIETWNGSTKIGESSELKLTLSVPESVKPSVSFTVSEATDGVASKAGAYVKGVSTLYIKLTDSSVYNATIASRFVWANSTAYNAAEITTNPLTTAGSMVIEATVTDTRGRTATATKTINVLDYAKPYINTFTVNRTTGSKASVVINGGVTNISGNTPSYRLEYKKKSDETYKTYAISDTTVSINKTITLTDVDPDYQYDFRLTVADQFYSTVQTRDIGTEFTLIDFNASGKSIAIGKVSEASEGIEIELPIILTGKNHDWVTVKQYIDDFVTDPPSSVAWAAPLRCRKIGTHVYVNGYVGLTADYPGGFVSVVNLPYKPSYCGYYSMTNTSDNRCLAQIGVTKDGLLIIDVIRNITDGLTESGNIDWVYIGIDFFTD